MANNTELELDKIFNKDGEPYPHQEKMYKNLIYCITFLSKIKTTFTLADIYDLLNKHANNDAYINCVYYNTVLNILVKTDLMSYQDGTYKLTSMGLTLI